MATKRTIRFILMLEKGYEPGNDQWYRCSIRHLIGMMILGRVEHWKFELWIWPKFFSQ